MVNHNTHEPFTLLQLVNCNLWLNKYMYVYMNVYLHI